jgi:protoporphyrinogen oxidase
VGASVSPRIAILGAGPVGLGAAYRLLELGHSDFTVYERDGGVGGLAASVTDGAGFTYDVGGHVMFSHYEYFDRLVDRMLGDQYTRLMRESWIRMCGRWIPYPLQNNVRHLPPEVLLDCLNGLVDARTGDPGGAENFADWIQRQFGEGITRHFMAPYNRKVWAHPLEMMSKGWIAERVSVVDLKRILSNVVHQRDEASWGPNNTFKYPLHGGTGGLYSRFVPYLGDHLQLRREVVAIDPAARRLRFADGGGADYDVLVSAAPIPQLLRMLTEVPEALVRAAGDLHHSHGVVVGVGVARPCETSRCWTYFPEADCPFYRVTFLSNYSPNMAPAGHTLLLTETSWSSHREIDRSGIVDRVIDGLVATELLRPEDRDRIVAVNTREVEHFYPIPTLGRDRALARIQPWLMARDIYSRGRFGAWKYEISNMDHCVMQGVEAVDSLLLGHHETTWRPERPAVESLRLDPGEGAGVGR